jgi:hypothetical protein
MPVELEAVAAWLETCPPPAPVVLGALVVPVALVTLVVLVAALDAAPP